MDKEIERNDAGQIVDPGRKYSDRDLISELQSARDAVDGDLTQEKYNEVSDIPHVTPCDRFGSWNEAKETAGIATNEFSANVTRSERNQRITDMKEGAPCESCGDNRSSVAMDFHHTVPDEKTETITAMCNAPLQYSWSDVLEELENCVIVCKSCHAEIEWGDRPCP